jgi:hypothetical protein
MTTKKKISLGCLGTLVLFCIIGYITVQWLKRKAISTIADAAKITLVEEIKKSPLPPNQKKAFLAATDEILSAFSTGEIDINFNREIADKPKAVKIISKALKKIVNSLNIEDEQKEKIAQQMDRFGKAYSTEKISEKEITKIFDKIAKGNSGMLFAVWASELVYINASGLSESEKFEAHNVLGRLIYGLQSNAVPKKEVQTIAYPYTTKNSEGKRVVKPNLSDDEIRNFLSSTKELLNRHSVPSSPGQFDIGGELKNALDAAGLPK